MTLEVSYGIIPFRRRSEKIEVLLIQHQVGHWAFPKGRPDPNEHPIDTAQRELQEETGLRIKRLILPEDKLVEHYFFERNGEKVQKKVEYFLAEVEGKLFIQEDELRDSIWLTPDLIVEQATYPESKRLCARVRDFLNQI